MDIQYKGSEDLEDWVSEFGEEETSGFVQDGIRLWGGSHPNIRLSSIYDNFQLKWLSWKRVISYNTLTTF